MCSNLFSGFDRFSPQAELFQLAFPDDALESFVYAFDTILRIVTARLKEPDDLASVWTC